jgi:MFS family permease
VLQGVGAAAITSTAFAVPADLFPPSERSRYMGLFGASFGLASVIGPFVGGLLTDHLSWRWIFYVNLPLGAIAMAFILAKMPKLQSGAERHPIDIAGTVLLVLCVVPLMLGLSLDPHRRFQGLPLVPLLFAISVLAGVGFVIVERRAKAPVIPFELFHNRTFTSVTIASFLFGAAFMAAVLFLAIFMVNVVGVSATDAGTAIIPLMMGVVFGGIYASHYTQRTGKYKMLILAGSVLMAVGFWLGSRMNVTTTRWDVMWRMVVIGLGAGPAMPLLSLAMQNAVPMDKVGTATAGRQFFAQMGQALGAALFGMVLSTSLTSALDARLTPVLAELPPAVRTRFDPAQFRNSATGDHTGGANAPSIADRVAAGIREDEARRRALGVSGGALPLAAVEAAEQARGREIATAITLAVRGSFAIAIARVYFGALFVALALVALIAFTLPELPLRTSNKPEAFEALEPGA